VGASRLVGGAITGKETLARERLERLWRVERFVLGRMGRESRVEECTGNHGTKKATCTPSNSGFAASAFEQASQQHKISDDVQGPHFINLYTPVVKYSLSLVVYTT
jgi:hypothetical protein